MPISFVVGFFGMNFTGLPFDSPWLLAGAIGMILVAPLLMLYWFKQRGWLSSADSQYRQPSTTPEAAYQESRNRGQQRELARTFPRREHASDDGRGADR
jgi:CorA-like Mg2+ transporter protein